MSHPSRAVREEVELTRTRAQFLRDASDLLLETAPSTSALLSLQHDQALATRDDFAKQRRQSRLSRPACAACGNPFTRDGARKTWEQAIGRPRQARQRSIPSSDSSSSNNSRRPAAEQPATTDPRPAARATLTQCRRCGTIVKQPPPRPAQATTQRPGASAVGERAAAAATPTMATAAAPPQQQSVSAGERAAAAAEPQSENRSAKARARARKKGGLLEQVERAKRTQTAGANKGPGFGLMDFLSPGS